MTEYQRRPLGDLVRCLDEVRRPVKAADRTPGPYPYYGASGIVDRVDDFLLDGPHLLIAEDGENLRSRNTPIAFMATGKFWVNNHAHVVVGNEKADTRFLAYAVQSSDVSGYLTGSTQPKLTQQSLLRLPIVAPPLPVQRAIVEVLGALDDMVESNRGIIDTAARILDAVAASAVGSTIPLAEVVRSTRDRVDPRSLLGQSVDLFSIPAFDAGPWPERCRAESIASGKFRVSDPSVLLSRLNPRFPRLWHAVPQPEVLAICSTEFMVLRPAPSLTLADVWLSCSEPAFRDELVQRATGTSGSHQRVRPDDVLTIPVVDPWCLEGGVRREAVLLLALIERRRSQNEVLVTLRNVLLPELLSGRLSVARPEQLAEAAP